MAKARLLLAAAPVLACALPAQAQTAPDARTFQPPAGCTAHLTVQEASCAVAHHYTCEADPAGWQRRVVMDEGGLVVADLIDDQTQWMQADYLLTGSTETLAPSNPDPASLDTLLTTGVDSYDFTTDSLQYGQTRYVGEDRLSGGTVTIDGVALAHTTFSMVAFDANGAKLWRRAGEGYVSRDWRRFFGGAESTATPDGEVEETDGTPVEFIFPGEPGFLSVTPRHGCGELMSKRAR